MLDLDWTTNQQEGMAYQYYGRAPRQGRRLRAAVLRERAVFNRATIISAWSRWAADGVIASGVNPDRVRVIPPGIDLSAWPAVARKVNSNSPVRCLFVGNDYRRKGGDLVAELARTRFRESIMLDVVTGDEGIENSANVTVHRAGPNSEKLRDLFARAELFIMPSRAEAFGIAYLEAMASGLAVIAGDTGGVHDIVADGVTGWVVAPQPEAVAARIQAAIEDRTQLHHVGARGRARVEERFDARNQALQVIDSVIEMIARA